MLLTSSILLIYLVACPTTSVQSNLELYDAITRDLSSGKFTFMLGKWPELQDAEKYENSEFVANEIQKWIQSDQVPLRLRRYRDRPAEVIDSVVSDRLRSRYYLYHIGFDELPPKDLLLVKRSHDNEFIILDSIQQALQYLNSDWIASKDTQSIETSRDALDIVTILSLTYPLYVIRSIDDVRNFQRIVTWSAFWDNPGYAIWLSQTLSSFRLDDIGVLVDSISTQGLRRQYNYAEFESYRDNVFAPIHASDSLGNEVIRMCTWSPRGGVLTEWSIRFLSDGNFVVDRALIAEDLGLVFNFI